MCCLRDANALCFNWLCGTCTACLCTSNKLYDRLQIILICSATLPVAEKGAPTICAVLSQLVYPTLFICCLHTVCYSVIQNWFTVNCLQ